MPYQPTEGSNAAFGAGTSPAEATGRVNQASIGPAAQYAGGLSYEGVEREAGTTQPGQIGKFMDEMSGGDDNVSWTGAEE
jgi:hypothetical protein